MDAAVLDGLARWPDVPDVYGWLALDRRGRWLIRGGHVTNAVLHAYIGRNYARDERGAWFFQNGPQRVFVELECTPWVLRLTSRGTLETHTGLGLRHPDRAACDESGRLFVRSEFGWGLVHDRDLAALIDCLVSPGRSPVAEADLAALMAGVAIPLQLRLSDATLPVSFLAAAELPVRGCYVARPKPSHARPNEPTDRR